MTRISKKYIAKIENVLKLWRARNLSREGKIIIFKSLVLSNLNPSGSCENNATLHNISIKQNTEEFYLELVKS